MYVMTIITYQKPLPNVSVDQFHFLSFFLYTKIRMSSSCVCSVLLSIFTRSIIQTHTFYELFEKRKEKIVRIVDDVSM